MSEAEKKPEKNKRKYTRKPLPPKPETGSHALQEVDRQIAQALASLPEIHQQIAEASSELQLWQQKSNLTEQHIQKLVTLQRQLQGHIPAPTGFPVTGPIPAPGYSIEMPPAVSSIPAKRPAAGPGNAADDIRSEGGFS